MATRPLVRGILATALVWGVVAVPLTLLQLGIAIALGADVPPMGQLGQMCLGVALRGAVSGAAFAGVLSAAATGRTLPSLRAYEMASWGALGALVSPAVVLGLAALTGSESLSWPQLGLALAQTSLVGAGCGVATLALARRPRPHSDGHPPALGRGAGGYRLHP